MLSGPNATFNSSETRRVLDSPPPHHHGLQDHDARFSYPSRGSVEGGGIRENEASVEADLGGEPITRTPSQSSEGSDGRLNLSQRRTGSPVDKIVKHEAASISKTRNRKSTPTFSLVARGRTAKMPETGLSDLSNEVLTHILSHLPPPSLSEMSLVSKRFHDLVTTPHAWRSAFGRFFPGSEALNALESASEVSDEVNAYRIERRYFTRLTAAASWRSEYILRTRLLRALGRGRPADFETGTSNKPSRSNANSLPLAQVTYSSSLSGLITHLHSNFGANSNKKAIKVIHGTDDYGGASISDARDSKVESWGSHDYFPLRQFEDIFPGEALYGLGAGDMVGVPNVMDVSQVYGMVYGEGLRAGKLWYRSLEEKRGRALLRTAGADDPEHGVPALTDHPDAVCSVWIAKSNSIPNLSDGMLGIIAGSSTGVLTAYSIGTSGHHDQRFERGEITARWILSPGVPIIGIAIDEFYSAKRHAKRRIWAVALNALGEVFYLDDLPKRSGTVRVAANGRPSALAQLDLELTAWATGRSVHWHIIEPTRRVARPDPFDQSGIDGGYTPRSSWHKMYLTPNQLAAEARELSTFLRKKPKDWNKTCYGWDMQRRLEVDVASCDDHEAGEAIFVIKCGLQDDDSAEVKRFTRLRISEDSTLALNEIPVVGLSDAQQNGSLFGGPTLPHIQSHQPKYVEEWRTSVFGFGGLRKPQITASAIDMSTLATITTDEDPERSTPASSVFSSPLLSPLDQTSAAGSATDVPGQNSRLLAVGSKTGTIFVWNARAPTASNSFLENTIKPLRIIYTESPQISCLALTALYIVHGGNDGLVQAWDPLASNLEPIRTLNSRFSSRARRRLVQAEASPAGVGVNLFAAGAICLDPDPTVLRGIVSLGSHLRYWSYSSLTAEQYKGKKRRPRRSERGSNASGDKFSGTGRGAIKEYIANEKLELEREKKSRRKEEERLAGRFGMDLLGPGASEDEIMAYATMLSEEALQQDEVRRRGSPSQESESSSATMTEDVLTSPSPNPRTGSNLEDEDLAEAINLSLEDQSYSNSPVAFPASSGADIPIRYAKPKRTRKTSPNAHKAGSSAISSPSAQGLGGPASTLSSIEDLRYALDLSRAEEESRRAGADSRSESVDGKGKARDH